MYRIGEFSKMSRVTIKTLRYYDEAGLLKPCFIQEENGYRYYNTQQLLELQRVIALRQAGLSIEETRDILSGQDIGQILHQKEKELKEELEETVHRLSRIQYLLSKKKEAFLMDYQADIKTLPAYTVFYKEGVVSSLAVMEQFILTAEQELKQANPQIRYVQPDYCYLTYLDPEFREQDLRVEYAQAVTKEGKETEHIHFKEIESVQAVCVYHKGPYERLGEAFAFAFHWVAENGYEVLQRPRERYIDGRWNQPDPALWLTEIQIPVVSK